MKQTVTTGVFWSEGWLNGMAIPAGIYPDSNGIRINQVWELNQGWNYYFAKVGVYDEILNTYIALPVNKGLIVAADKQMDSAYSFNRTKELSYDEYKNYFENKTLPLPPGDEIREVGGWQKVKKTDTAYDVCRENYWDIYAPETEILTPDTFKGHVFRVDEYPEGFSVFLTLTIPIL